MIKQRNSWVWIAMALAAAVVAAGCVGENKEKNNIITETPQKPTSVVSDKLMEKHSIEKLESMADTIIIGEVIGIQPSRWSTPDGKKPTEIGNISYIIYTDVVIKVEKYLKNPSNTINIIVRVLGGTVGGDSLEVEDQPSFNLKEELLIFLKKDSDPITENVGDEHLVTAGLFQGKMLIQNGEVITESGKMTIDELRAKLSGIGENTTAKTQMRDKFE